MWSPGFRADLLESGLVAVNNLLLCPQSLTGQSCATCVHHCGQALQVLMFWAPQPLLL